MAEGLGVLSSAFAVVSLAIQVAESIEKLKTFCSLIQGAPDDIRLAVDELETLGMVLEDVDRNVQQQMFLDPRVKTVVLRSYRLCKNSSDGLRTLVDSLQAGLAAGKKRGSFKIALKRDAIEDFRKRLESAKATMLLANQVYYQSTQTQRWESLERDMHELSMSHKQHHEILVHQVVDIRSAIWRISEEDTIARPPSIGSTSHEQNDETSKGSFTNGTQPCFSNHVKTKKQRVPVIQNGRKLLMGLLDVAYRERGDQRTTSYSFRLPHWIYGRRFELHLMKSCHGWDQRLRTYRTVPYDAMVFAYCMDGNVNGLQHLFGTGQASPFEVDPDGRTPLHYATLHARPEASRFLIELGADANAPTSWQGRFGGNREAAEGRGWYRFDSQLTGEQFNRGWPAYSTPLHLLLAIGAPLITHGRGLLSPGLCDGDENIIDDFQNTVEVLVICAKFDLSQQDQYHRTSFQAFTGPSSTFTWLRQQELEPGYNFNANDIMDILWWKTEDNWIYGFDLVRQLLPVGSITPELSRARFPACFLGEGRTLFHMSSFNFVRCFILDENVAILDYWKNLTTELLTAGTDLHAVITYFRDGLSCTTFLIILWGALGWTYGDLYWSKRGITIWLDVIQNSGVNLQEYISIEKDMLDKGNVSWASDIEPIDIEDVPGFENWCVFELLDVKITENGDSIHFLFDDLWATTPLAAEFWDWIEDEDGLREDFDTSGIPGSWTD